MKKLCTGIAILVIASAHPALTHAQFLKKIVNSVKQTVQNNTDNKADNTTNKVLDNADNATQIKGKNNSPGDTSGNTMAIKFLGKMTGGGGVSAADSASAISGYMRGSGGSGIHYQYLISATTKKKNTIKDTMNAYYTNSGRGRSEINLAGIIAAAEGVKAGSPLVVIGDANQPRYSIILDAGSRQYSLNVIDTSLINSAHESYQVTKIGNETVGGYSCTHAKLTSTSGKGMFKSTTTMDIWTSPGVPGYSAMKKWMAAQNVTPRMMQALDQAGCGGFFVKMASQSKDLTYNMELIRAEQNSFPASMFQIPPGYTKANYNLMMANMVQAAMTAGKKK